MLDRVLGRAELKDEIDRLEDRVEGQQAQVESAKESRAEAVSARQRAEEEVNRLEDRIAELEDRVARVDTEGGDLEYRHEEVARGDRIREVATRLRSVETSREGALTAYVDGENAVPEAVREQLGDRTPLVARAAPCLVCTDDAGLVATALSLPVAPDPFAEWTDSFRVDSEWVRPVGRTCFALVRSDLFACGIYEDGERVEFAGFESDVMNDHSKGGFSQARFERRRDSQIAEHVEESRAKLDAFVGDADRVVVVGDRGVIGEFRELADETAAVDASGAPEAALEEAFEDFWTVTVRGL